jgi:ATP-binding cassette, subfamily B, bacterial
VARRAIIVAMVDPAAAERPKARSLTPLRALLPFLRPYRGRLALALAALLVAAAAMLALPVAVRQLVDYGLAARTSRR